MRHKGKKRPTARKSICGHEKGNNKTLWYFWMPVEKPTEKIKKTFGTNIATIWGYNRGVTYWYGEESHKVYRKRVEGWAVKTWLIKGQSITDSLVAHEIQISG